MGTDVTETFRIEDAEARVQIELDETTLIFDSVFLWAVGCLVHLGMLGPQTPHRVAAAFMSVSVVRERETRAIKERKNERARR